MKSDAEKPKGNFRRRNKRNSQLKTADLSRSKKLFKLTEPTVVSSKVPTTLEQLPKKYCSLENSIIVCCAGKSIRWTENEQHSGNSKTFTLAPLVQNSDVNDPTATNHNKFAVLMTPVPNNQRIWVVPPKTDEEVEEERRAGEERRKVGQQMKLKRLASSPLVSTESTSDDKKVQWVVPPKPTCDRQDQNNLAATKEQNNANCVEMAVKPLPDSKSTINNGNIHQPARCQTQFNFSRSQNNQSSPSKNNNTSSCAENHQYELRNNTCIINLPARQQTQLTLSLSSEGSQTFKKEKT
jgi:hypothetical protein